MTTTDLPGGPEDVVRGFLRDVRSGARLDRVHHHLAPLVLAHQGPPGAVRAVVERTPDEYADHVREMLRAVGPWRFEVLGVASAAGRVEAAWRQTGAVGAGGHPGQRVVEHGRATYLVEGGRITQYWIDARQEVVPDPDGPAAEGRGRDRAATGRPGVLDPAVAHRSPPPPTSVESPVPTTAQPAATGSTAPDPAPDPEVLRYTAFSADPDGGNPAGVVLDATAMTPDGMLATAARIGYSETAFLVPRPDGFDVRYFSPRAEVSFCGHATIASAVAHAERHGPGHLLFRTAAGPVDVLTARAEDGSWRATLTSVPPRTVPLDPGDRRDLLRALRWSEADLDPALPARVAYAGAWHPVLAGGTRSRLAALDYDVDALAALVHRRGWTTVDLVWREDATTFHARNPFPPGGVVEDPATGAAAAALGGYLRELSLVDLPATVTVLQGADMGRPSRLTVDVPQDPSSGIRVTGTAVAIPRP